ncbi:MAG TPA: c-type cytochrome domain-containing protein, partial [Pirellulales bacterium]|nr:c-type cytochrome domain-containing protein [Pirellulales bacterium]
MTRQRIQRLCAIVAVLGAMTATALAQSPAEGQPPSFEFDARPVFKAYCFDCHGGGEKLEANLDLRLTRFAAKGGDSGPAIVPGNAAGSLLV